MGCMGLGLGLSFSFRNRHNRPDSTILPGTIPRRWTIARIWGKFSSGFAGFCSVWFPRSNVVTGPAADQHEGGSAGGCFGQYDYGAAELQNWHSDQIQGENLREWNHDRWHEMTDIQKFALNARFESTALQDLRGYRDTLKCCSEGTASKYSPESLNIWSCECRQHPETLCPCVSIKSPLLQKMLRVWCDLHVYCIQSVYITYYMWKQETWHKSVDREGTGSYHVLRRSEESALGRNSKSPDSRVEDGWQKAACQEWWCQEWYMVVPCGAIMMPGLLNRTVSSCLHPPHLSAEGQVIPEYRSILEAGVEDFLSNGKFRLANGKHGSVSKRSDSLIMPIIFLHLSTVSMCHGHQSINRNWYTNRIQSLRFPSGMTVNRIQLATRLPYLRSLFFSSSKRKKVQSTARCRKQILNIQPWGNVYVR